MKKNDISPSKRFLLLGGASALAAISLGGCAGLEKIPENVVVTPVPVNMPAALRRLNAYRLTNSLAPVKNNTLLDRIAMDMAVYIAKRDTMSTQKHSSAGLASRLDAAGYPNVAGAENLGAGYADYAAAFTGWVESADHNHNLLNPHVTEIGLAHTKRTDGKWRNFWVMILARPKTTTPYRPEVAGVSAM